MKKTEIQQLLGTEQEIQNLLDRGVFYCAQVVEWPWKDGTTDSGLTLFLYPVVMGLAGSSSNPHHSKEWFPSVIERIEQSFGPLILPEKKPLQPLLEATFQTLVGWLGNWWSREPKSSPPIQYRSRAEVLEDSEYFFGRDAGFDTGLCFAKESRFVLELRDNNLTFLAPNDLREKVIETARALPGMAIKRWETVQSTEELRRALYAFRGLDLPGKDVEG